MANFMKVTESGGTVTVNVTDTLTVNSNEVLTTADFGAVAGAVAEGNHSHQTIGDNILTGQTIEASVTAPAAVYFNVAENLWKGYNPTQNVKKIPALFIGNNSIALNGAVVDLVFNGDVLFIVDNGAIKPNHNILSTKMIMGYRIGSTKFKINYDEYDFRLKQFCEKLQANDIEAGDAFGYAVSINGDTAIVGADLEDTGSNDAGSAYIFRFNGNNWIEEQKLQASDIEAEDHFGKSVTIFGDVAIVGANLEDTGGDYTGAAYVFRYNGIAWIEEQKLQASDKKGGEHFGISVSISGNTAIIGACGENTGGTYAGAAYIFRYNGTIWVEEQKILASDTEAQDFFGYSVCISGDTAIVGADCEDTGASNAGAAYIYRYNGSSWLQEQKLQASDIEAVAQFGWSVSISEDTAIIGSLNKDEEGINIGAVYIFRYNGSSWIEEQKLLASDAELDDKFGYSVSISNDTIIVGAYLEDTKGIDSGAAYVFKYNGISWVEVKKIYISDSDANDKFGSSVAISDDTAIVGAHLVDSSGTDSGAVYIYDLT